MLKLSAGYAKKVPVEGVSFSSRQYSAEVEVEVSCPASGEEIKTQLKSLYAALEDVVEAKLAEGRNDDEGAPEGPSAAREKRGGNGRRGARNGHATDAQQAAILEAGKALGMSPPELAAVISERFGTTDPARLSRPQASHLIDWLRSDNAFARL
jgi:hypothetical protein